MNKLKNQRHCLMLVLLLTALNASSKISEHKEWVLKKEKKGIQVYTKPMPESKYLKMRGEMQLKAGINELASLLKDPGACPKWVDMCQFADVIKVLSENETYVYTYHNLPWPFSNRDSINHVVWKQNDDLTVTMEANAIQTDHKVKKNAVRITQAKAVWQMKLANEGQIKLSVEIHIDPAGQLPSWFTNMMSVKSLYKTFVKIRRQIKKGAYKNIDAGFIDQ